jgi:hypothetical protein
MVFIVNAANFARCQKSRTIYVTNNITKTLSNMINMLEIIMNMDFVLYIH